MCAGTCTIPRVDASREKAQWWREVERCRSEIAAIEAEILAGNPDLQGLCLALSDWSAELRILKENT